MNLRHRSKKSLLTCLGGALFLIACSTFHSHTVTDIDRTMSSDGTIIEREHTVVDITRSPTSGTLTVNALGASGTLGVTFEGSNGQTTETEAAEGEQVDAPEETTSVTTESETTTPGLPGGIWNSKAFPGKQTARSHSSSPFEFREDYMAWPDPFSDVTALVSIRGHKFLQLSGPFTVGIMGMTPRHVVKARATEIGQYFREGRMGLLPNGAPAGTPLPSFPDAEITVREVLLVEPTATGANFHYYDTLPFEWIQLRINGNDYGLQTPGSVNMTTPITGWYHAVIPVPASELQQTTTYDSTIKKLGSSSIGGRSMVLDL